MQLIDLTQTFEAHMPAFPGDPVSELKQISTIEKEGFNDHQINTAMHVGTHMDAPLHMIEGGKKISEINPENFFGRGILVDARGQEKIDAGLLKDIQAGDIVLVMTGFDQKFGHQDYFDKYPELTEDFANKVVEKKVKIVGLDLPSPDRSPFAVHKILLGHEILIIENLTNLEKLINKQFEIVALPAKLETDAAPVRVVAKIN